MLSPFRFLQKYIKNASVTHVASLLFHSDYDDISVADLFQRTRVKKKMNSSSEFVYRNLTRSRMNVKGKYSEIRKYLFILWIHFRGNEIMSAVRDHSRSRILQNFYLLYKKTLLVLFRRHLFLVRCINTSQASLSTRDCPPLKFFFMITYFRKNQS